MKTLNNLPMPDNMEKADIIDLLLREEYGYLPPAPLEVSGRCEKVEENFCAGKATLKKIIITCKTEKGYFTFPVHYVCPKGKGKFPCFIHINFRDNVPDIYQPTEEIIDAGYAVFSLCYQDITSDNADFTDGLAGVIYENGERTDTQCGKIGLWAWGAMRVMDYVLTLPEIDSRKISIIGHSRLGKTALLAGALDERFYCAFSNNSGCSGAALSRGKGEKAEKIENICTAFPYWFNKQYKKYMNNEDELPFDQHFLLAANVPHKVYVASAQEDLWAAPESEYLSCVAASGYYKKHGYSGFVSDKTFPEAGDVFHDGSIGYHVRKGTHYLSREDWQKYIEFLGKKG